MTSFISCAIVTTVILVIGAVVPCTLAFGSEGTSPNPTADSTIENAVVKIFTTKSNPDPYKPWTKQAPQEVTGSGVVIEGKRILTNAHVVLYASQLQVQANQGSDKISATVEAVAPGIDLAILKLEDETFFNNHPPLERTHTLPEVKDTVMAYGFGPIILARILDGFPQLNTWVCWAIGAVGSVSVLYHGIGMILRPDQTKGFGLYLMAIIIVVLMSGLAHFAAVSVLHGKILQPRSVQGQTTSLVYSVALQTADNERAIGARNHRAG